MMPALKQIIKDSMRDARMMFISGLLVVVPLGITIFIIFSLFNFFDSWFRTLKNYWLYNLPEWIIENIPANTKSILDNFINSLPPFGVGFILTIVLIFMIGFMTRLYLGQKMVKLVDWILHQIPGVSWLYKGVKQVFEQLLGKGNKILDRVVFIEYPRKGIYTIGFVTGQASFFNPILNKELYYVFIVTTPNPTSGFLVMMPNEDMIDVNISVEDAMKLVISGGIVAPSYDILFENVKPSES